MMLASRIDNQYWRYVCIFYLSRGWDYCKIEENTVKADQLKIISPIQPYCENTLFYHFFDS